MTETVSTPKQVRFSEENKTIYFCEKVSKEFWYTREDYSEWKRSFRQIAKRFRHNHYGILLKDSFENPPQDIQQRITACAQLDEDFYLRGIEKYSNKQHDIERATLKERNIQGVLRHQRRMKRKGNLSPDELAEELSFLQHQYSRPAVQFARRTGAADELVVCLGENPQKANQMCMRLREEAEKKELMTRWNSSDSLSTNSSSQARRPKRHNSNRSLLRVDSDLLEEISDRDQQQDSWRTFDLSSSSSDSRKIIGDCPPSPACPAEEIIRTSKRHLMASIA